MALLSSYAPNSADIPLDKLLLNGGRQSVNSQVAFDSYVEFGKNLIFNGGGTIDNPIQPSDEVMPATSMGFVTAIRIYVPETRGYKYEFERPVDESLESNPENIVVITRSCSDLPYVTSGNVSIENGKVILYIGGTCVVQNSTPLNLTIQFWLIDGYYNTYIERPSPEVYEEKRKMLKPKGVVAFEPIDVPLEFQRPLPAQVEPPAPRKKWDFKTMKYI